MITAFRISESVSDNAVNFGRINAPIATPGDTIVKYDYAGKHLENISTFPDRAKFIPVQYDKTAGGWKIDDLYATDVKITNRFYVRKGVYHEIPLYYKYTSILPLKAAKASFDGVVISNEMDLYNEYKITDRTNVDKLGSYLHNVEFIPFAVHHGVAVSDTNKTLFYLQVFSNGSSNQDVHKIRFKAIDTNSLDLKVIDDHYEYLSVGPIFDVFNINYDLKDGIGADLLGWSYPDSTKNPLPFMDSSTLVSEHIDTDRNLGRSDGEYTLFYHYQKKAYWAMLSESLKSNTAFMNKPLPWLSVYYNGVATINSSNIALVSNGTSIVLKLIEPGTSGKQWEFSIAGKSSTIVAAEINNSGTPFSVYPLLRIKSISTSNLWVNNVGRYTDLNQGIPAVESQYYDSTSDGGLLLRSIYFYSKYTAEPTVSSIPPSDHKSNALPWYPMVKFGGYAADDGNAYYVNEYASQGWSNRFGYPYRDISGENVFMLDAQTIQCKHTPIFNNENHLVLTDSFGTPANHLIDGIDSLRGLIFLKTPFTSASGVNELFLSYSYEEKYVEVQVDMNPLPGHTGRLNKYYVVSLNPYVNADRVINTSTVSVDVTDSLPDQLTSNGKLILAAYLVTDTYSIDKYRIDLPTVLGGGLNRSIPLDVLNKKVPDLHSFTDIGYVDGLRFPANCVLLVDLPNWIKAGTRTIITEFYDHTSIYNKTMKLYGAVHIKPGTTIVIGSGGSQETAVVIGAIDHTTVKLATELTMSYNVGTPVSLTMVSGSNILDSSKNAQFDEEGINQAVSKFMTVGTQYFITYK